MNRSRLALVSVLAFELGLGLGCVRAPKLSPDVVGISRLPSWKPELSGPSLPSVTTLAALPAAGPSGEPVVRPAYTVGPLDQLVITVWGRKDLGSQVPIGLNGELHGSTVREDGTVILPFLEPLQVRGKTIEEIRGLVGSRYAKLVEKPQVDVKLQECASRGVQVNGEVARPGRYYLCADRLTVGEVLSAAGSPTLSADLTRGTLERGGTAYRLDASPKGVAEGSTDVLLEENDTVYFPRLDERVVYVLGEVVRQGTYPIPKQGLTLLDALGKAYGPDNVNYNVGGIYLIRKVPQGNLVVCKLKMAEILQAPDIYLTSGDRVFVATSGLTRWDRFWRKFLPFGTVFGESYAVLY